MNKFIGIIILILLSGSAWAQTKILTGKVTEKVGGQEAPAIGVNVVVANKQNRFITGVTTNLNGAYSITIPDEEGLTIQFSFIGMKTQTVKYTGQQSINVVMTEDNKMLDEVTVIQKRIERNAMGISDKEQTSATQRVKMDDIMETSPVTTIEEALQGQLGGVDIVAGGDPGAKSSIRIRGTNSLNASSEPLIVIDGVPYSTDIDDDFDFSTANDEDFGQLLNISPTDLESIEVLKDAAATAIYGTAGANGVLLIKTKRGSKGKTRFNFSTKFTASIEPNTIPMLNGDDYVALMGDAIWNTANAKGISYSADILRLLFDTPEINYNPEWRYFDEYNQNIDWLDEVRHTALTTDNNFAMSGGGDKATYRFSLGYMNQGGTTIGTNFARLSSALNINYNFSERLRVDADFSFAQSEREANWANVRSEALRKMPNKSPYWIDDVTGKMTNEYFSRQTTDEFQGAFKETKKDKEYKNFHPIAMAKDGFNTTTQRESKITFRLNYDFAIGLTYQGWVSMNIKSTKGKKFLPQSATGVLMSSEWANRSSDNLSDNFTLQTENKLLYRKNWNEMHNLIATALLRTRQSESSTYSSTISGAASPNLADPTTGGTPTGIGSGSSEVRSMSGILSVHYTLFNKYMFSATVNAEGNSAMGASNRWGYFPAVGFGWQLHEENFLREKEWLELAKIRFSWGTSGTSPSGASPYIGTFKSIGKYWNNSAIAPERIQLNNLKWETSAEYNVGADLTFLKGKINFTFDYYNKLTKDLLQKDTKVPQTTGFASIKWFNSGQLRNKGLEFRVDYEIFKNKDWRVAINANVSRNVNEIEELPDNLTEETYSFGNGNYASRLETGTPVGSFFGYKYKGVYQNTEHTYARDANGRVMNNANGKPIVMRNGANTLCYPGDAMYEDINHDGVIDQYDIVYIGNGMPVMTGGGGFSVKYKTWTLTTLFHGRFGQKVINRARMNSEAMYNTDNQSKATLRRWRSEGDDTDIPRALYQYGYNYLGSDRFVEKASYLRLKTLSLNYAIPKAVCQRWGINNLNVFLTGYDLFTWTKYTGQDPEVSLPSDPKSLVEDKADTPRSRRFAAGISINF